MYFIGTFISIYVIRIRVVTDHKNGDLRSDQDQ